VIGLCFLAVAVTALLTSDSAVAGATAVGVALLGAARLARTGAL
jgi:hypothetical protein